MGNDVSLIFRHHLLSFAYVGQILGSYTSTVGSYCKPETCCLFTLLRIFTLFDTLCVCVYFVFKQDEGQSDNEQNSPIHGPEPAILRRQSTYWDEHVRWYLKLQKGSSTVSCTAGSQHMTFHPCVSRDLR